MGVSPVWVCVSFLANTSTVISILGTNIGIEDPTPRNALYIGRTALSLRIGDSPLGDVWQKYVEYFVAT
jgi:hypothetical protein